MKKYLIICLVLINSLFVVASGLKGANKVLTADYTNFCEYKTQADLPTVDQLIKSANNNWETDFRSCDLSRMDLSAYPSNLADYVDFDSKTKWPAKDKMPAGFNPKKYLKEGRNPGLHVRDLHKRKIDGRGVSIAIIDQPLLYTHQEYKKQLKLYHSTGENCLAVSSELCNNFAKAMQSSMHGPAVASIAVGKTVGVAPKADLYYFSAPFIEEEKFDARPITQTLQKILWLNTNLPEEKRIFIVSISRGFNPNDIGAEQFQQTLREMKEQGIVVFTTNSEICPLSRGHATDDADDNAAYTRGATWWPEKEFAYYDKVEEVLFPIDYRVTAAPNGNKDYVAYQNGGMSWAVPYAAGLYALGRQVYPDLTPELFWKTARETSAVTQVKGPSGKKYRVHHLVQPVKLIEKLESLKK